MFQLSVECPEEENKGQDDRQVFFGELEPHELLISLLVKRKNIFDWRHQTFFIFVKMFVNDTKKIRV